MEFLLLFHFPASVASKMVRLVLEEKDLEWESRPLNSLVGEELEPWYVEDINDLCNEPAMIHDNKAISNPHYICCYLERHFPNFPLMPPEGSKEHTVAEAWFEMSKDFPAEVLYRVHAGGWRLEMAKDNLKWQMERLEALAVENPALAAKYRRKEGKVKAIYTTLARFNAAQEGVHQVTSLLDKLEEQLQAMGNRFVAGGEYTLADAAWTALLHDLECYDLSCLWAGTRRRAVARYYRRMRDRPSYETALEDHLVTIEFVLPYYMRVLKRHVLARPSLWVGLVGALATFYLIMRRPGPAPIPVVPPISGPIMITFPNLKT